MCIRDRRKRQGQSQSDKLSQRSVRRMGRQVCVFLFACVFACVCVRVCVCVCVCVFLGDVSVWKSVRRVMLFIDFKIDSFVRLYPYRLDDKSP